MTSTFPSAPDNIQADVVNGTAEKDLHPNLHNQLADAVNAVQASLLPGGALTKFSAGTVTAPSITFSADTNTGFYNPAPDQIGFTAGGAQWMGIGSTGLVRVGDPSLFPGYTDTRRLLVVDSLDAPTTSQPMARMIVSSKGDNATQIGAVALHLVARDRPEVTVATKGNLYGLSIDVVPIVGRTTPLVDDVAAITIMNSTGVTTAQATDGIYFGGGVFTAAGVPAWYSLITGECNAVLAMQFVGKYSSYGIDFGNSTVTSGILMRMPNNTSIVARNAANNANKELLRLDAADGLQLGAGAVVTSLGSRLVITTSGLNNSLAIVDSGSAGANINLVAAGGYKFLRAAPASGDFQVLNAAFTTPLLTVTDAGQVTAGASIVTPLLDAPLLTPTGNIVEQRRGTTAQTLRIYGTYTDASNYERLALFFTGARYSINAQIAGTGTARTIEIVSASNVIMSPGGNDKWNFNSAGVLAASTDNASDIGQAGATRPRNIFVAGAVATGTKAGAPVDADVNTPTDGMLRVDTTNHRLYVRDGGTWRYAALT